EYGSQIPRPPGEITLGKREEAEETNINGGRRYYRRHNPLFSAPPPDTQAINTEKERWAVPDRAAIETHRDLGEMHARISGPRGGHTAGSRPRAQPTYRTETCTSHTRDPPRYRRSDHSLQSRPPADASEVPPCARRATPLQSTRRLRAAAST